MMETIFSWFGFSGAQSPIVNKNPKGAGRKKGNCPKMKMLTDFQFHIKDMLVNKKLKRKEVAKYFGVSYMTFYKWLKANPHLGVGIKQYTRRTVN